MKFIIESSKVPIYNRIATAFANTLLEFGHIVFFIDASEFKNNDFIQTINDIDFDYYVSTNELNYIQKKSDCNSYYIFEKIHKKIIFIHHDNVFSGIHNINEINQKLEAFLKCNNKTNHFLLERSNVDFFKQMGISNAYITSHASEFKPPKAKFTEELEVSFVGHLMSSLNLYPSNSIPGGLHLQAFAWNRLSSSSYPIQPNIFKLLRNEFFFESIGGSQFDNEYCLLQYMIGNLNKLSSAYRGELISSIKQHRVDIFGGDLSYGKIKDPLMKIEQDNIHYQPPTANYLDASNIYKSSKININISSLQFDSAINNRIIDVIASGGFIVSDKRSDLVEQINSAKEIVFETPEELNFLISYYKDKKNISKYKEIKTALFEEASKIFTYQNSVTKILNLV